MSLEPGARFAGYQVERLLARGGMGEVYLARHEVLRRVDAVKVLRSEFADDPVFRERFLREAHLAARVRHAGIVTVYTAGEVAGRMFIASEYIVGGDLRQHLSKSHLDHVDAMQVVSQVAAALDAAHGSDLVHRDVKPENVLVQIPADEPWRVFLTDFGITRLQKATTTLTEANSLLGTVGYIAPEQILGARVDGRADQYSLGCMAFECLTGELPFGDLQQTAMLKAHLQTAPPPASARDSGVPQAVDAVLGRALSKDPADRFDTCRAFAIDLAAALNERLNQRGASDTITIAAPEITAPVRDLVVVAGPCSGLRVPLTPRRYVVGRSAEADVPVPDRFLSRRHFALDVSSEGAVQVSDAGSANGTLVEGRPVVGAEQLREGAWIAAGASQLTILGHRPLTRGRTGDDGQPITIVRRRRENEDSSQQSTRRFRRVPGQTRAPDAQRLRTTAPDAAELWVRAVDRTPQLWERCSADSDALSLRVGTIAVPAGKGRRSASQMPPSPLTVDLLNSEPILVTGDTALTDSLLRWLLVQAVCLLGPDELQVLVALPSNDPLTWSWLSLLPHTQRRDSRPAWSADLPGSRRLVSALEADMDRTTRDVRPFPLRRLVIADSRAASGIDEFRAISGPLTGVAVVLVARDESARRPSGMRQLHLDGDTAQLELDETVSATPDGVAPAWAREIGLALSRLVPAPRPATADGPGVAG